MKALNAEWDPVRQEEVAAKFKTLQEDFERTLNQVILERDDLISTLTTEEKTPEEELSQAATKRAGDHPERGAVNNKTQHFGRSVEV